MFQVVASTAVTSIDQNDGNDPHSVKKMKEKCFSGFFLGFLLRSSFEIAPTLSDLSTFLSNFNPLN